MTIQLPDPTRGPSGLAQDLNFGSVPTSGLRRPRLSLWLLKRALGSLIRRGTLTLRLPDGAIQRFGEGVPEIAIAIRDWRTLRGTRPKPSLSALSELPTRRKRRPATSPETA